MIQNNYKLKLKLRKKKQMKKKLTINSMKILIYKRFMMKLLDILEQDIVMRKKKLFLLCIQ